MNIAVRFLLVAFLIWLVPFLASFLFIDRTGQLTVNFWLFKAVMVALLCASAFVLFGWFYRAAGPPALGWPQVALLGLGAMAINIGLDLITVVPLTRISLPQYGAQIASLYLLIVVISVYTGLRGV